LSGVYGPGHESSIHGGGGGGCSSGDVSGGGCSSGDVSGGAWPWRATEPVRFICCVTLAVCQIVTDGCGSDGPGYLGGGRYSVYRPGSPPWTPAGELGGGEEEQSLPTKARALTAAAGCSTKRRAAAPSAVHQARHAPVHMHRGVHGEAEGGGTWRCRGAGGDCSDGGILPIDSRKQHAITMWMEHDQPVTW
jgi:hypothetical protein